MEVSGIFAIQSDSCSLNETRAVRPSSFDNGPSESVLTTN